MNKRIQKAIITAALEDEFVQASFAGRLFWLRAPANTRETYAVFSTVSGIAALQHDGLDGIQESRVQCDVYSATWPDASEARDAVISALNGLSGAYCDVRISCIQLENTIDFFEDEPGVFRASADFLIQTQN
jgi:hypothetical protein